VETHGVALVRI